MNASDNVVVVCDHCGNETKTRYNRYNDSIKKYGSYYCSHCNQKHSLEKRQESIYNRIVDFCNENNYVLVTEKESIMSQEAYITYICPKHGEHKVKASSILEGKICYECSREIASAKRWQHGLDDRIYSYYQMAKEKCDEYGYKLISSCGDFSHYKDYLEYECKIHGVHKITLGNLLSGKHCPECSAIRPVKIKDEKNTINIPKNKLSMDEVIYRIEKCGGKIYNPEDYINQAEKNLKIQCPRCGNVFITSLTLFTQHGGQLCPDCYKRESVGEQKVRMYLESHSIPFYPQYWFKNCRDKKPLPFDFYLYKDNIIIEYDGIQHFYDRKNYFNNTYSFETTKKHDDIKNNYCKDNNIRLIRIPYWKIDKIEETLDKELYYSHEDIV